MPRVSVIIPTYNRAHVVGEAIDSVLAQTYQDFEIIVVDDGSTDNTREVLEDYARRHPDKMRVIYRQTNGGAGAARNDGIRASQGEYIAFLDSDDLYLPNRLESAVRFLDEHPEYGAAYAEVRHLGLGATASSGLWVAAHGGGRSGHIFAALCDHQMITTPTVTIRRSALERAGSFDEQILSGQDTEMWWRVARQTPIGYVDAVVAAFRAARGSLCRSGSRSTAHWVRLGDNALRSYRGLTRSEQRALQGWCCRARIYHALALRREGHGWHAGVRLLRESWVALRSGLPLLACDAAVAAVGGERELARLWRAKRRLRTVISAAAAVLTSSQGRLP